MNAFVIGASPYKCKSLKYIQRKYPFIGRTSSIDIGGHNDFKMAFIYCLPCRQAKFVKGDDID